MKKVLSVMLTVMLLVAVFCVANSVFAAEPKNGFVRENDAVYYYENDEMQYNRWVSWNDNLYYLDYDGKVVANQLYWVSNNNSFYYFNSKGVMQKDGFIKHIEKYSYEDENGETQYRSNTHYYYAAANGRIAEGWKKINGYTYYFYPEMATDGVNWVGSTPYLFTKGGILKTTDGGGWLKYTYTYDGGYSNTEYYYSTAKGALYTGWKTIGGNKYYLGPERYTDVNTINDKHYYFNNSGVLQTGFTKIVNKYDGWTETKYYLATKTGILLKGWQTVGDKKYYFADNDWDPYMYRDGVYEIDSHKYYFNASGVLGTGWIKHVEKYSDGTSYTTYLGATKKGVLLEGWQTLGGKKYYFDKDSWWPRMYRNSSYKINNKSYVFDNSGVLITKSGWVKLSETFTHSDGSKYTWVNYYYLDKGTPRTGWQKLNGNWYYFDTYSGDMYKNGSYMIEKGKTSLPYVFEKNGALTKKTGWVSITNDYEDETYTFYVSKGVAKTGWKSIGGNYYYFNSYGQMAKGVYSIYNEKNGTVKTYFFKDNGVWVKNKAGWVKRVESYSDGTSDTYYYYFVNGLAKTGWKGIGGNYYFFDNRGVMATGIYSVYNESNNTSKTYFFKDNGVWVKDKAGWAKRVYKYSDGSSYTDYYYFINGVAKVGWKVINGNSYCFRNDGSMYKDGTYEINGKNYTFNAKGVLVK